MKNDITQDIKLKDILFSLSTALDLELKDKILLLLNDSGVLEKPEKDLVKEFETLCKEVNGIPIQGTLVSRDVENYSTARVINKESIEDFTKIFIDLKKKQGFTSEVLNYTNKLNTKQIDFNTMADKVREALNKYAPNEIEVLESNIDEGYLESLTKKDDKEKGIKLGIECIDSRYPGLRPGELNTVAGYAGSMKTTIAANWCYNAITLGFNVLYISLEISKENMMYNILSRHSNTLPERYTRDQVAKIAKEEPEEFMKLGKSLLELEGKFRIVDENDIPEYSVSAFNNLIENVNNELIEKTGKKIGVIVIDHLQLLKFAGETKSQDPYMVGNYYVSYFRELAAKYGYAVIVVSQTSRQGFEYATKHNGMYLPTGLAESNELERASTLIITTFLSSGASATSEIQMAILKNRNGERMQETETAPINPEYYMVGTGLAFEPELVPPVFETSSMETMQNSIVETKSLEEILAEEMNFEGVF